MATDLFCHLSASGFGSRLVRCTKLVRNVAIAADQTEARFHRTLYPTRLDSGDFSITIICETWARYDTLSKWLQGYIRAITDPNRGATAMRVQLPARNFNMNGVPKGPITFGDRWNAITYEHTLEFIAVEDPVSFDSKLLSTFRLGRNQQSTTEHFYPGGDQEDAVDRADAAAARRFYDAFVDDVGISRPANPLGGSNDELMKAKGLL